ncbi:MAG: N-acetyltransferase [Deltaproteobacteria bacterium]|nr:N-acetyltransferase [Deltaproteobacteria bacterium]
MYFSYNLLDTIHEQGHGMEFNIRKAERTDKKPVIDILNYYIESSFAAYPEKKAEYSFFDSMKEIARGNSFYVIEASGGQVIGFGLLKKVYAFDVFNRAGEVGYFIKPEYTHRGLGIMLLSVLENDAMALGIETLLASVSSMNPESIAFHLKNGFVECGRFVRIGLKHGKIFDVVWMQKDLK